MMTQTFDLKTMGLSAMSNLEMEETDGGLWMTVLAIVAGCAAIVCTGGMALAAAGVATAATFLAS